MTTTQQAPTARSTRKLPQSRLLLGLIVLTLLAGCGWFFGFYLPNHDALELSGVVQAQELKNASRFGGRVTKILVQEGDWVEAGQELIRFDDLELRAKIADASAALTEAKSRQSLMLHGADVGDLKQASSQVEQASQRLKILNQGAQPEQVSQAQAALTTAQNKLAASETAYKNADRMLSEGIISQQKYDELKRAYETAQGNVDSAKSTLQAVQRGPRPEELQIAKAQLSAAQAQYQQLSHGAKQEELAIAAAAVSQTQSALDALQAQLGEVTLRAPIRGLVSVISVAEGELVQAGRPVVTIIDPEHLWTDVYVPESHLGMIQVGQPVSVKPVVIKNQRFQGRVAAISPKSEFVPGSDGANTGEEASFKVKITIDNPAASPQSASLPIHPDGQSPEAGQPKQQTNLSNTNDIPLRSGMNVRVTFNR